MDTMTLNPSFVLMLALPVGSVLLVSFIHTVALFVMGLVNAIRE